jgi:hypothetical protein
MVKDTRASLHMKNSRSYILVHETIDETIYGNLMGIVSMMIYFNAEDIIWIFFVQAYRPTSSSRFKITKVNYRHTHL